MEKDAHVKIEPKLVDIDFRNRLGLIISSLLISVTLLLSWIIWVGLYNNEMKEFLTFINDNSTLHIQFSGLTIITLVFVTACLFFVTVPFILIKKNNLKAIFMTSIGLVIGLVIIMGSIVLAVMLKKAILAYAATYSFGKLTFFIVPWILEIIYAIIFLINCCWLFINIFLIKHPKKPKIKIEAVFEPIPPVINLFPNEKLDKKAVFHKATKEAEKTSETKTEVLDPNKSWSKTIINKVWEKGIIDPNFNPNLYRKDYAGAVIFKKSFININEKSDNNVKSYSWTIVYQKPISAGGSADIDNLFPMNINNATSKGTNYPKWQTSVTFNGQENYYKTQKWKDKK